MDDVLPSFYVGEASCTKRIQDKRVDGHGGTN